MPTSTGKLKGLYYSRPILCEEATIGDSKKTYIVGTAIDVGISRNNVNYTAEELRSAAESMIGTPLLLNHGNKDVRNIVGRVVEAEFKENSIPFKAELDTDEVSIVNKVKKGFINSVSIGADYEDVDVDVNGVKTPKGIEFLELSLVPIPGVKNGSISQMIEEQYNIEKQEVEKMETEKVQKELEEAKKTIEQLKEENTKLSKVKEEDTPEQEEDTKPKEEESKVKMLEEQMKEMKKMLEDNKGVVDKPEVAEKKPEMKIVENKNGIFTDFWGTDEDGKLLY